MKAGDVLVRRSPWLNGTYKFTVLGKRALNDGDYAINAHGVVFKRVGNAYLSKTERQRKFWVVELGERVS